MPLGQESMLAVNSSLLKLDVAEFLLGGFA